MTGSIGKLSAAAFPVVMIQPRARSDGGRARADVGASTPEDPNLALLEVAAGQVSESTGEPCDASRNAAPGEVDPSYRMELMGFIVGSLSRAVQAVRAPAPEVEEPVGEEEEEEPEAQVEAALPEAALPEAPVEDPAEAEPRKDPEAQAPAGYSQDGHAREGGLVEGKLTRWA